MTEKTPNNQCPRCLGAIPNNDQPGAYMGALSRVDNHSEICSPCGVEEAMLLLAAKENWPVFLYDFEPDLTKAAKSRALAHIVRVWSDVDSGQVAS